MYVKPILIKKEIKSGKIKELKVNCYIPSDLKSEKVVLFLQFEDSEGYYFGSPLIGIIDID